MEPELLKKKNIIKTDRLEIGENVIKYDHSVIQLSNISYFTVAPMSKTSYPVWTIIGIIIGLILLFCESVMLIIIGLAAIAICVFTLYKIHHNNSNLGDYLILYLNCGNVYSFSCYNKDFLLQVEKVITECFKDKTNTYSISLKDCVITNQEEVNNMTEITNTGNIAFGNGNSFGENHSGAITKSVESINENDWKQLAEIFQELLNQTAMTHPHFLLLASAQYQIAQKDQKGLRKILEDNKEEFKNSIFSNIATSGLFALIKKLTGINWL